MQCETFEVFGLPCRHFEFDCLYITVLICNDTKTIVEIILSLEVLRILERMICKV